jgi:hypothetical protein
MICSTHVTLSTISPLGTNEENRKLRRMALIPVRKQRTPPADFIEFESDSAGLDALWRRHGRCASG